MRSDEFMDPGSKHTGMTSMEVLPYHAVLGHLLVYPIFCYLEAITLNGYKYVNISSFF
jgi:hypothetical protein